MVSSSAEAGSLYGGWEQAEKPTTYYYRHAPWGANCAQGSWKMLQERFGGETFGGKRAFLAETLQLLFTRVPAEWDAVTPRPEVRGQRCDHTQAQHLHTLVPVTWAENPPDWTEIQCQWRCAGKTPWDEEPSLSAGSLGKMPARKERCHSSGGHGRSHNGFQTPWKEGNSFRS